MAVSGDAMRIAFGLDESAIGGSAVSGFKAIGGAECWIGGRLAAGPGKVPDAPALRLMLCDLLPGTAPDGEPGAEWWVGEQILPGGLAAPAGAGGLLCNLMSIDAAHEEEFNAWYDTEHMARIGALSGVLAARRFRAIMGTPGYAAFYHLESLAVTQTTAWADAARSPWTTRIQRYRTSNRRLGFVPERGA